MAETGARPVGGGEREPKAAAESVIWLEADKGYGLGLEQGKLVARNPKGKRLASVPKWLKQSELAEQLLALSEWLDEHRTECLRRIEMWMLRSLPVPRAVIEAIWSDADWRELLRNLVVTAVDGRGRLRPAQTGLLREVDASRGIGVVDRDGETQWLRAAQVLIPHPILIDGLEELREIAADLGFSQSVEQLFRAVFTPREEQMELTEISDFSGGKFAQLNFAVSLCRRLGYPVRGGYSCCRVWENSTAVEARYWIGADYPEAETYTGELIFVDSEQIPQWIKDVGPVTFSEGMRMASQIYAKREVEKEEGAGG